jgi:hypothetical protein
MADIGASILVGGSPARVTGIIHGIIVIIIIKPDALLLLC